jgi:hypothetical protein
MSTSAPRSCSNAADSSALCPQPTTSTRRPENRPKSGSCDAWEASPSAGVAEGARHAEGGDAAGDDDPRRGDSFTVGQGEHEAALGPLHLLDPATIHLGHRLGLKPSPVLDKRFPRHWRTDGHAGGRGEAVEIKLSGWIADAARDPGRA